VVGAGEVDEVGGKCWVASTGDGGESGRRSSVMGWVGGAAVFVAAALMWIESRLLDLRSLMSNSL
jgi:hypothetical protein